MMTIVIEEEYIHCSKRGVITAPIYFDFGDFQFPEVGWSDFIVIISGWWLDAIQKLNQGWEREIELCFMDGPMIIKLTLGERDDLLLECVNQRGRVDIIEYKTTITKELIVSKLLSNAKNILKLCRENNWQSADIDTLSKLVK